MPLSTRIHTNNATQLGLQNVPPNLFQNCLLLYSQLLKSVSSPTTTLSTPVVFDVDPEKFERSENPYSRLLSEYNSNKTYDFSTLYTSISHTHLKSRLKNIIRRCYSKKDGTPRCKYVDLGRDFSYFVKNDSKSLQFY